MSASGSAGARLLFDLERRIFEDHGINLVSDRAELEVPNGMRGYLNSIGTDHSPLIRAQLAIPAVFQPLQVNG